MADSRLTSGVPATGRAERTLRVALVDDEPLANAGLRALLARHPDATVVGEATEGRRAAAMIRELAPDVVFLDVQMPGLDGFGVLRQLGGDALPVVIFVTAYDEFAVRAFEARAADYLLKPVSDERFDAALDRARELLRHRRLAESAARLRALLDDVAALAPPSAAGSATAAPLDAEPPHSPLDLPASPLARIAVRVGRRSILVPVAEIDWIAASDDCATLHVGARTYLLRETLASLEACLDAERFVRVHRGAIVNADRVVEVQRYGARGVRVVLADGTRVEVSRRHHARLARWMSGAARG